MKKERLLYFDGLRGIAAILVITTHISLLFFENLVYKSDISTLFDKVWVGSPLNILSQANISVRYFFILSGFLITRKVYRGIKLSRTFILKQWWKLLQLTVPSILLVYLLMKLDLVKTMELFQQTGLFKIAPKHYAFQPNILSALKESLFDIFFTRKNTYNGPLWTIRNEFFGSILIYYLSYFVSKLPLSNRKYLYILAYVIVVPINYNVADFILGALVWDTLSGLEKDDSFLGKFARVLFSSVYYRRLFYVLGFYLACTNDFGIGLYAPFSPMPKLTAVFRALGVAMLFFGLYRSKKVQQLLSHSVFLWLGKLSPYIYIFHWPIMISFGLLFYLSVGVSLGLFGQLLTGLVMIVLSILFSWLYYTGFTFLKRMFHHHYE